MATKHYKWSAINTFGAMIISFVGNVFIARLLSPEDYGLVAMLAIFIAVAMNFTESGFADYLIRTPDVDKKDYSTVFVHNIVLALIFYGLLVACSKPIANFYDHTELIDIIKVIGLSIVLKAASLSEMARMRKELQFKKIALITLASSLLSTVFAYVLAKNNFGYWALVYQAVIQAGLMLLLVIIGNRWLPSFKFSLARYKKMRSFGNNMLASYLTNQLGDNLYTVVIGKVYSAVTLGFYAQAQRINMIVFRGINTIVLSTSYSLIAKEQDKDKRKAMYKEVLSQFTFIHFFISFLLIGVALPLIVLIYGLKWQGTVIFLQLMLLAMLFNPLVTVNANISKVENKTHIYRNLTFFRNGLNFIALAFTFRYSVEVMLLGQVIAKYISALVAVALCGKHARFYLLEQLKIVVGNLFAPLFAFAVAFLAADTSNSSLQQLSYFLAVYSSLFILLGLLQKNKTLYFYLSKFKRFFGAG